MCHLRFKACARTNGTDFHQTKTKHGHLEEKFRFRANEFPLVFFREVNLVGELKLGFRRVKKGKNIIKQGKEIKKQAVQPSTQH